VPASELAHAVHRARGAGADRLVTQVPSHVRRQLPHRIVPASTVLLEGLHHDPVEIAAEGASQPHRLGTPAHRRRQALLAALPDPLAGPRRLGLSQLAEEAGQGHRAGSRSLEREGPGQQLVEEDTQGVHVGTGVHVDGRGTRLLGAHVLRSADHHPDLGQEALPVENPLGQPGDPEVDDLGHRSSVDPGHEYVRRFEVPVDDPLLVGVLDGVAHLPEELQALADRQSVLVAEGGQGEPVDVLHGEEVTPGVGQPRVEDLGDPRVVHPSQGLALRLEPRHHPVAVPLGADDLHRHPPADRLDLVRLPDMAHAPGPDATEKPVAGDRVRRPGRLLVVEEGRELLAPAPPEGAARGQGVVVALRRGDQLLEALPLRGIELEPIEQDRALLRRELQGLVQDGVELVPAALAHEGPT